MIAQTPSDCQDTNDSTLEEESTGLFNASNFVRIVRSMILGQTSCLSVMPQDDSCISRIGTIESNGILEWVFLVGRGRCLGVGMRKWQWDKSSLVPAYICAYIRSRFTYLDETNSNCRTRGSNPQLIRMNVRH